MESFGSLFDVAAAGDYKELGRMLKEKPDLINSTDSLGNRPLHYAAKSGSVKCVQLCLDTVVQHLSSENLPQEINSMNNMNQDPLTFAVFSGELGCVELLLSAGADRNYSWCNYVYPLEEALKGSNVAITHCVLENLTIDFSHPSRRRRSYWLLALHDPVVSLEHFKLLKRYNVQYSMVEYELICNKLISLEPDVPGLEEFLLYICKDAVDRWVWFIRTIKTQLLQVSVFCLKRLTCYTHNMETVNQLRRLGVFNPPTSLFTWVQIFEEWGLHKLPNMADEVQYRLLNGLIGCSEGEPLKPITDDKPRLALILYMAVLATRFPQTNWLEDWLQLCRRAGILTTNCTSSTLVFHMGENDHSRILRFWHKIFFFVITRCLLLIEHYAFSSSTTETEFQNFLSHVFEKSSSSLTRPTPRLQFICQTFLYDLVNNIQHYLVSLAHPIFVNFCKQYLFTVLFYDACELNTFLSIPPSEYTGLFSRTNFLEVCLDFSPFLVFHLTRSYLGKMVSLPSDNDEFVEALANKILPAFTLAHLESMTDVSIQTIFERCMLSEWLRCQQFKEVYVYLTTPPFTLFRLTKFFLRLHLRKCIRYANRYPRLPLSHFVNLLPGAPLLHDIINDSSLSFI